MDLEQYNQLYYYLDTSEYPDNLSSTQQYKLKLQAKDYFIQHQQLYYHNKKQLKQPQWVIKITEVEIILYNSHLDLLAGHFGIEVTY